jgi:hypothetical protein
LGVGRGAATPPCKTLVWNPLRKSPKGRMDRKRHQLKNKDYEFRMVEVL